MNIHFGDKGGLDLSQVILWHGWMTAGEYHIRLYFPGGHVHAFHGEKAIKIVQLLKKRSVEQGGKDDCLISLPLAD